MVNDYRLWRIKQPCSCAQHCHHLRYFGHGLRNVPCCTRPSKCFSLVYPSYWVTRAICPHKRGSTMDLSNASPRLLAQSCNTSWGGSWRSVSVLLLYISKRGQLHIVTKVAYLLLLKSRWAHSVFHWYNWSSATIFPHFIGMEDIIAHIEALNTFTQQVSYDG